MLSCHVLGEASAGGVSFTAVEPAFSTIWWGRSDGHVASSSLESMLMYFQPKEILACGPLSPGVQRMLKAFAHANDGTSLEAVELKQQSPSASSQVLHFIHTFLHLRRAWHCAHDNTLWLTNSTGGFLLEMTRPSWWQRCFTKVCCHPVQLIGKLLPGLNSGLSPFHAAWNCLERVCCHVYQYLDASPQGLHTLGKCTVPVCSSVPAFL